MANLQRTPAVTALLVPDDQAGMEVDAAHGGCFFGPFLAVVLHNAHGLDPQVPKPEGPRQLDGILDSGWKNPDWNGPLLLLKVGLEGPDVLAGTQAPAVAQRRPGALHICATQKSNGIADVCDGWVPGLCGYGPEVENPGGNETTLENHLVNQLLAVVAVCACHHPSLDLGNGVDVAVGSTHGGGLRDGRSMLRRCGQARRGVLSVPSGRVWRSQWHHDLENIGSSSDETLSGVDFEYRQRVASVSGSQDVLVAHSQPLRRHIKPVEPAGFESYKGANDDSAAGAAGDGARNPLRCWVEWRLPGVLDELAGQAVGVRHEDWAGGEDSPLQLPKDQARLFHVDEA